jgi:hypothetical protein
MIIMVPFSAACAAKEKAVRVAAVKRVIRNFMTLFLYFYIRTNEPLSGQAFTV